MRRFFTLNESPFLIAVLFAASFLRLFKLSELMSFIPDQGWFYLSARDMLVTGVIPLVGPHTSHPWIHHGAHWTYTLAFILYAFNFDPVAPGYFIAILGTITVILYYSCIKELFSKKVAVLSSILFATSPLIVMNARIPYHTSPLPFFVILLFFLTFKWVKGNVYVFPVITFLLGVLYNHEITTFVYTICIFLILLYGIINRKKWAKSLMNKKIIILSFVFFIIPMIPFILYDINNGFKQTLVFLIWVIYRIIKLPLSLFSAKFVSSGSNSSTIPEFLDYYSQLEFASVPAVSIGIFLLSLAFIIFYIKHKTSIRKSKQSLIKRISYKGDLSHTLLILFLSIGLTGLFVNRVPIEADTLLISPFLVLLSVLSILWIARSKYFIALVIVLFIAVMNSYFLLSTDFYTNYGQKSRITYSEKIKVVDKTIYLSNNKPFNIKGRGSLSDFPVFTMPYQYLLWWKGRPPSTRPEKTTIIIEEKNGNVDAYKE